MIISLYLTLSRRLRIPLFGGGGRKKKGEPLRMISPTSMMFVVSGGKVVAKLLDTGSETTDQ